MAPTQASPGIQLLNLPPDGTVHQRLFLLVGQAAGGGPGDSQQKPNGPDGYIDVQVTSQSSRDSFAPVQWEVNGTWFKALVPLFRGDNVVTLTHRWSDGQASGITSSLHLLNKDFPRAPLHLVILAASDSKVWSKLADGVPAQSSSPATPSATAVGSSAAPIPTLPPAPQRGLGGFLGKAREKLDRALASQPSHGEGSEQPALVDTPPGWRRDRILEGGLREIKRRFALQALTWQAFHAEQMYRQGFGHRTFPLEEEDDMHSTAPGSFVDLPSLPRVHVLRSAHSVSEFRAADNAQQHKGAKNGGAMHSFAGEALNKVDFWRSCPPGSAVAVMILDTTWDPSANLLRAHAAVGSHGGLRTGTLNHGVMGSHWLWACPSSLNEVTPAFLDAESTDSSHCCNDLGEGRTVALTINIGSGAMIHEAGHALDNPHWPSGIMARGYIEWNRAFMTRETHSLRGGARTVKPISPSNDSQENHLHRCQAIRARLHPSYARPTDPTPVHRGDRPWDEWVQLEPSLSPTAQGINVFAAAGIAKIVVDVGDKYRTHLEFGMDASQTKPPVSYLMTPEHIRQLVGFDPLAGNTPEVKLLVTAWNLRHVELNSYRRMGLARSISIPGVDMGRFGREVRNGPLTKVDDDPDHQRQTFLLNSAWPGGPPLTRIEVSISERTTFPPTNTIPIY